ncbi:hypothetical protein FMN52_02085 [Marinobacter sp. BW6]|uniref:hypothetical protein n=1 Tax=Marinobacter sp. BW6 TaxID=2592624 RepID=UPI0011DE604E|nr:hypothetical protein [Marinobacter sp. BW6]TYC62567.1 hypothetical protein FMN52_02085 [Marinobacter sp. BW6]
MKKLQELDRFYWFKRTQKNLKRLWKKKAEAKRRKAARRRKEREYVGFDDRAFKKQELKAIKKLAGVSKSHQKRTVGDGSPTGRREIKIPRRFSIIDSPLECLQVFKAFKPLFDDARISGVLINHEDTLQHDLGAEILLGKVAKGCMDVHRAQHQGFEIEGQYPESPGLQKLIRSVGIVKELEVAGHTIEPDDAENEKVVIFKRKSSGEEVTKIGSIDHKTKATQDFVAHIDHCLQQNGSELTSDAKQDLAEYIGEIIANAQDHSGVPNWQIYGYLDRENEHRICEVVIFNYGNTFAKTFKKLPQDDYARIELNKYLERHEKSGIFRKGWSEDSLITLFSLQGRISSKNKPSDDTRGHGTVSLIEFFQSISRDSVSEHRQNAKMCILSGSEHIRFDGTYRLKEDQGPPIIAFNKDNDLRKEPDSNYVRSLRDVFFPGSLIAIQFILPDYATKEIQV